MNEEQSVFTIVDYSPIQCLLCEYHDGKPKIQICNLKLSIVHFSKTTISDHQNKCKFSYVLTKNYKVC